jgi:hypothetical protein
VVILSLFFIGGSAQGNSRAGAGVREQVRLAPITSLLTHEPPQGLTCSPWPSARPPCTMSSSRLLAVRMAMIVINIVISISIIVIVVVVYDYYDYDYYSFII